MLLTWGPATGTQVNHQLKGQLAESSPKGTCPLCVILGHPKEPGAVPSPCGCPLDDTPGPLRPAKEGVTPDYKLSPSCLPPRSRVPLRSSPPPKGQSPGLTTTASAGPDPTLSDLFRPTFLRSRFTSCLSLRIYLSLSLLLGHFVRRAVDIKNLKT